MSEIRTVTTVYTMNQQPAPQYSVVSQPVQVSTVREETTFQGDNVARCKKNGVAQAITGMLCIIFGIVSICLDCYYAYISTAIWAGSWFMWTGLVGMRVAVYRGNMAHRSLHRFMYMGTVCIVFSIMLIILMSLALAKEDDRHYQHEENLYNQRMAMDAVILVLSCFELLASLRGVGIAQSTLRECRNQTTVITRPGAVSVPVQNPPGYGYQTAVGSNYAYPPNYGLPSSTAVHPPPQAPPQAPPPTQYGFAQPQPTELPPSYGSIDHGTKPPY